MRLLPGTLLALTLLLTGCGAEGADEAEDPGPTESSSTESSSTPTNGPVDFTQVAMVSESAVGGQADPSAVDLTDDAALADFVSQFEDERMTAAIEAAVAGADVADGETLVGAVVALGCVPPTAVTVELTDAGLEINAVPAKNDPEVQCLVAITSVAVVAVDASLV